MSWVDIVLIVVAVLYVLGVGWCWGQVDTWKERLWSLAWPFAVLDELVKFSWETWGIKKITMWRGASRFLDARQRERLWVWRIPFTRGWGIGVIHVYPGTHKCEQCDGNGWVERLVEMPGHHLGPPERETEKCDKCNGTGARTNEGEH